MNLSEFRARIYDNYYDLSFKEKKLNKPEEALFKRASLGFEWNYGIYMDSLKKDSRVLDIGCGIGQCLFWLNQRGLDAIGIDTSMEQIEQARKVLKNEIKIEHADAFEYLKSTTGKYDAVVANDLIEHMTRPEALEFVSLVHDKIKENGFLIVKAPNAISHSAGHFYDNLTHKRPYTESSIQCLLKVGGFEDIRVHSFEHYPYRNMASIGAYAIRRLTWNLYRARLFLHDFSPITKVVGKQLFAVAKKQAS
ncbi:MAG: class I SAM-dependent methyltransferase [Desulfobacterales bacterium]